MASSTSLPKGDFLLLAFLFVGELSMGTMLTALHMKGEEPFAEFLAGRPGLVFLSAVAAFVVSSAVILAQYIASKRSLTRHFGLIVTMNLVTVLLTLIAGEAAVRLLSSSSTEGETLGRKVLIPKRWDKVVLHNRQLLDEAGARPTIYVYDDLMGWTVGQNRRSADGLYHSSSEGLRAPHAGMSFAKLTKKTRIALVGNSYTFGEEVAYEDTWGYLLEKALGSKFEVLNFGVPGYGVDQAYLRFEKDVHQWKPDVVIFSFISNDVERTMAVYSPLSYPSWASPFSKPRFILRDGDLKKLNVPPITPEAIFASGRISDLPFLEYERGYRQSDWRHSWVHSSYLARAVMTWFPRWEAVGPDVSIEALVRVNGAILKTFAQSAAQMGAVPVVVYHPRREVDASRNSNVRLGRRVLEAAGVPYTEPTSCLRELNPADWFIPHGGGHYSPQGNAAVAKCLVDVVRQALVEGSVGHGRS